MRIGEVIGTVTLSRWDATLDGGRYRLVRPLDLEELAGGRRGDAEPVVVYDELGAGIGSRVGFSEGAEAAQPFRPAIKPLDAYAALLVEQIQISDEVRSKS